MRKFSLVNFAWFGIGLVSVTGSVLALALARLGREDVAVYDGSWTEWGGRRDTPVVP